MSGLNKRKYIKPKSRGEWLKHPIAIVLVTALLSSVGSIIGVKLSAPIVFTQFKEQRNYENKANAYSQFLMNMSNDVSSASIKLISLNQMVQYSNTDYSIQKIENNIASLVKYDTENKLFPYLISNMQTLRLYGSDKVELYINDFIKVFFGNDHLVDWELHDIDTREIRNTWINNKGAIYGWEPQVSDDDRAKFIILSSQYVELVTRLKSELSNSNI
ncbi:MULTISPECIES: hypothetical protein [Aeromonas]|uniref:Uncharacterized protein n=1 Tax=Aeromonas bestiarum TaxID=105751 RepID=A0ABT7Q1L7_9GAMM|nr:MULTISPECIES: hypothetical protein [Aeromonas]MCH7349050.1 hypothetical protein [Aeromonas sp. MR7]MDM5073235.1 hypothetical protein [Aeromonas bestiarum]